MEGAAPRLPGRGRAQGRVPGGRGSAGRAGRRGTGPLGRRQGQGRGTRWASGVLRGGSPRRPGRSRGRGRGRGEAGPPKLPRKNESFASPARPTYLTEDPSDQGVKRGPPPPSIYNAPPPPSMYGCSSIATSSGGGMSQRAEPLESWPEQDGVLFVGSNAGAAGDLVGLGSAPLSDSSPIRRPARWAAPTRVPRKDDARSSSRHAMPVASRPIRPGCSPPSGSLDSARRPPLPPPRSDPPYRSGPAGPDSLSTGPPILASPTTRSPTVATPNPAAAGSDADWKKTTCANEVEALKTLQHLMSVSPSPPPARTPLPSYPMFRSSPAGSLATVGSATVNVGSFSPISLARDQPTRANSLLDLRGASASFIANVFIGEEEWKLKKNRKERILKWGAYELEVDGLTNMIKTSPAGGKAKPLPSWAASNIEVKKQNFTRTDMRKWKKEDCCFAKLVAPDKTTYFLAFKAKTEAGQTDERAMFLAIFGC